MTLKNYPHSNIIGMGAIGQALRPLVPADLPVVFFCVKAFDLAEALRQQAPLWAPEIPFVTLCNGFIAGEIESVLDILKDRPLRWGMTTMGAAFQAHGELKVYGEGATTSWGPYQSANAMPLDKARYPAASAAEEMVLAANKGWEWHPDITPVIRRKWIFNTVLNTMCGALRLSSNGKLINHRTLADAVLEEAYELAKLLWPNRVKDLEKLDFLREQFWILVQKTFDNENSMARDVRLGRRTETSYLAGLAMNHRGFERLKTYHAVLARLG